MLKHYNLNVPTILNMHDIQHEYFPHYFSKEEILRRKMQYFNSAKYTTHMVVSGDFIKKSMTKTFPFIKINTSVILEGLNSIDNVF